MIDKNNSDKCIGDWSDNMRAIPREFLKFALFTVGNRKERTGSFKSQELFRQNSGDGNETIINVSGEELRQDDLDVYLEILHVYRKIPVGELFTFKRQDLIKSLGWRNESKYRTKLAECVERLCGTQVSGQIVRFDKETGVSTQYNFDCRLISEKIIKTTTEQGAIKSKKQWSVVIPHSMKLLFDKNGYARIDIKHRQALGNNVLAKFLHAYLCSNKYDARFMPTAEEIMQLTNSAYQDVRRFKARSLKDALAVINSADIGYQVCMNESTGKLSKESSKLITKK
ncbi:RepB family plasmid replication initiator protein [Pseudoalteromonas sp. C2R02]|uniref:plasmid replication initiator TrfA n=1 Tax=Pseudoalteromonas sp. C2R02 TaxID=2841565 RepID=UPI001C08AEDA|nr:plasmid replication initiator TrfA [Pseudoalteromonas sp. C2R02]MBU2968730.1 RepB family plasmid replication initiator protein [Pseudoalteromonas sp. C2R02]